MPHITVTIEIDLDREQGKFAAGDDLAEMIAAEIEGADPGEVETDEGATYSVTTWDVTAEFVPAKKPRAVAR